MKKNIIRKISSKIMRMKWSRILNDRIYLSILFYIELGYRLNLKNPKTYNEKLQWIKLYSNEETSKFVDKLLVRDYIAEIIGNDHLVKLYGVYNKVEEIEFDKLPNEFVVKTTHDSGGVFIVKNKNELDYNMLNKKINKSLNNNYFYVWRESQYRNISKKIIIEEYLVDDNQQDLFDYKFFCFNGKVEYLFIASERNRNDTEVKFDFYDRNFEFLPFLNGHPNSLRNYKKPPNFDKMVLIAELLSKRFVHVRVDLYNVNGAIYFGELTFTHFSGMVPFNPIEWDFKFGDYIDISKYRKDEITNSHGK